MELSAVGDRVFAAEAILKRRIRKVGRQEDRAQAAAAAAAAASFPRLSLPADVALLRVRA